MNFLTMQSRVWHLLREDGPDTGYPVPTSGDFPVQVVGRDLNIGLAQFISQTGIAPAICERMDILPVFPVLDQPVPPGLVGLTRIEYTPFGQQTYKLEGYGMQEFDNAIGDVLPNDTGKPRIFRAPFAGYCRFQPMPGPGNAVGPGIGTFTLTGVPSVGQQIFATLINGSNVVTTGSYSVISTDTLATVAQKLANLIAVSAACVGINAFLYPPAASGANQVNMTSLNSPGTQITYAATLTGSTMVVTPTTATAMSPTGDTVTWYYSSLGTLLVNNGDTPGIPPQFHMAPVYRVLMDYWARKSDMGQSKHYFDMFALEVKRGKDYIFDLNQATQDTLAGGDGASAFPLAGFG